ncbi:MAG TPA: hypothetical protein VKR83_15985 [Ktedonobacteraceae bacterium]|nr:hypothetical protein [Ktedonobacteraceae bacterium]
MRKVYLKIPILVASCVLVMLLALSNIGLAFARDGGGCNKNNTSCTDEIALDIHAGQLSITTSNPDPFIYNLGDTTQPSGALPLTINDNTKSGSGWTVSLTMTQFQAENDHSHELPKSGTVSFTAMSPACSQNTTCTLPASSSCSISSSAPLPIKMDGETSLQLCDSGKNAGMGDIVLNPTMALAVPANAFAGIYASFITVTVTPDV